MTIGENFTDYLGYNPLQNSIDVHLIANYVSPEIIEEITSEIKIKNL